MTPASAQSGAKTKPAAAPANAERPARAAGQIALGDLVNRCVSTASAAMACKCTPGTLLAPGTDAGSFRNPQGEICFSSIVEGARNRDDVVLRFSSGMVEPTKTTRPSNAACKAAGSFFAHASTVASP